MLHRGGGHASSPRLRRPIIPSIRSNSQSVRAIHEFPGAFHEYFSAVRHILIEPSQRDRSR